MPESTILFVDDEEVIRESFALELQEENFAVDVFGSGREAIAALEKGKYDLVITDLMMSGIDGFGVLEAAKRIAPQTGVIILTGYGDMRSAIDALRLGANDFALKPCDTEELAFRIRRCLAKRNLLQKISTQTQRLEEEISRRRMVGEQLRESENRFRLALDSSSDGVWERNLLTGELYLGENWLHTLGYKDQSEISDEQDFENLLHSDDREKVLALREAHIQGKALRYEAEYRIRNKAGEWRGMLSRGRVYDRDEQGKAQRMIGTLTDITRLKEMEAELQHSWVELEQRVQERTFELSETNVALTVLLKKREADREIMAEQVRSDTVSLTKAILERLKNSGLTTRQQMLVEILEANLNELTSPFANKFSHTPVRLTPSELQVANLVKLGKRTSEIADIMHNSPGTISNSRKKIREKLKLTDRNTNLQATLSINS